MIEPTPHLTDDQFAECLGNEGLGTEPQSPEIRAHLAACAQCREEMDLFLTSVNGFEEAAMGWTKAQPMFNPRAELARAEKKPFAQWSIPLRWATAAVLLLGAGTSALLHREHAAPVITAGIVAPSSDSPAQIAEDNKLLESVNLALGESDPSPFKEYGLTDMPAKAHAESRRQ